MTTTAHLPSRCERIALRGLTCNVRHWGAEGAPRLFMLHGRQDASPTFQFVVDALKRGWHVIALDWRGHGASGWQHAPYAIADLCADLEAFLLHYSPDVPACIVGHSLGARVAALVAGVRPERVGRLVMIDHLGLLHDTPDSAPRRMQAWLDAFGAAPPQMRGYPERAALAARLMQANPRLTAERAAFLAAEIGHRRDDGLFAMAFDPWLKVMPPTPYIPDDEMALWRLIAAPVLHAIADGGFVQQRFGRDPAELARRIGCFAHHARVDIADSGHNTQHDQPERLAAAIEAFCGG